MTKFYVSNPDRPIITIKGTINGKGPFNFIFDTGASMTIVEKQTAERLGLSGDRSATRDALGAGGALSSTVATIESIKIGEVEAKDIQVGILDLSNLTKSGCVEEFAGIIGYNFVKDHKVIIDYPRKEILFE